MADPLIRTKLRVPFTRPGLVSRPRLQEQIAQGLYGLLTLITAPAGFGKTTLVASCVANCRMPVAWLSLDTNDNQAGRFLTYLIAALHAADNRIGSEAAQLMVAIQPASPEAILTSLINDLDFANAEITLVLDDYQFISSQAVHEQVAFLLEHCPNTFHLVVATRSDPPLPLSRLRARGRMVELRAADLRFTGPEAAQFLNIIMGLQLDAGLVAVLEERTEGWVAGLQMAALSMQGREDISQFIQAFSGSHRYVLDYLAEEVFNRQPENVQHFLLTTSILDRLCGELCDALLESGFASSQSLLEYLDHANLFLVALDNERRWYRYHHLFADLLHARLYQSQPASVPELYQRASAWFDQNDLPTEAIQYALSASDFEGAAELIERHGTLRWSRGDPTLLMLASHLPLEILQKHPKLSICRAWMMIAQGQSSAALLLLGGLVELLGGLVDQLPAEPLAESIWLPAFINLLYGFAAQQSGAQAYAPIPDYHALELIPESDVGLRDTADFLYAFLLNRRGDFERSAEILERCVQRETAFNGPIAIFLVIGLLARIRIMQGKLPEAAALCEEYLRPVSVAGKRNFYAAGFVNIILGEVLYEWNNLEEAEKQIRQGIRDNEPWDNITLDMIGYMDLVSVQRARGDLDGTLETMKKLETMLQGRTIPLDLEEELWTYRVRLWLATGDLARASEWADRMVIHQPQDFLQEWGWITCARVRLAQGRYREARDILETLAQLPGSASRIYRQVRVDLLLSIVFFYQNQLTAALQTLEACLDLTEPGNYLRVFLDSGKPMRELLLIYLQTPAPTHKAYAQKLLDAFHGVSGFRSPEKAQTDLVEPLTPRELEVLRLLAAGCSNRQIAEKLVLAEGTVKFYVHAILEKLEVHSRTQAIAKARELNLA